MEMVCAEGKAKEQKPKLHSCNSSLMTNGKDKTFCQMQILEKLQLPPTGDYAHSSNTKSQTSVPKAICSQEANVCWLEKKINVSREPWEFCASLLVDSCCHQGHSLNNIAVATKQPQPDKETDRRTKG